MSDLTTKTAGTIYTKATTAGDDKCLILPRRSRFVASLNIPPWRRIAVGAFVSTTSLADDNAAGVTGSTIRTTGPAPTRGGFFGLFNSGEALPLSAGSYGYFMGGRSDDCSYRFLSNRAILAPRNLSLDGSFTRLVDGVPHFFSGQSTTVQRINVGNPAASAGTSAFASFIQMRLTRRENQTTDVASQDTQATTNLTSDVSMGALALRMDNDIDQTFNYATGYHEEHTPFFVFQWPFDFSRLRIHAWRVEVIETL